MARTSLPLLALAALVLAAPAARAASVTVAAPGVGPLSYGVGGAAAGAGSITFTVGLDTPTSVYGYDVTIAWDPGELSFLGSSELSGLGFDVAPAGATPAGERVAALQLSPVLAGDLFSVDFSVLPGSVRDGAADFSVFVAPANGGGLVVGTLANPAGAGIDVPEPGSSLLVALGLAALARAAGRGDA